MKRGSNHRRKYLALLALGLRMTLTGDRAPGGGGGGGDRHFLGAAYALAFSTLVAWVLYGRAAPGQFLLVVFTLSMLFSALSVLNTLSEGFFDPVDLRVTGHLPVAPSVRIAARCSEQGVLLLFLVLNFHLAPALFFAFMIRSAWGGVLLLAGGAGAALFVSAACFLLYLGAARFLGALRLQGLLLYLNAAFSLAVLGLVTRTGVFLRSEVLQAAAAGGGPPAFPPGWFAGAVAHLLGLPAARGGRDLLLAAAGTAGAVLLLGLAALEADRLGEAAARLGPAGGRARSAPGPWMRLFERFFVPPRERGAFEFTALNLARDRGFRLKAYPLLGLPLLLLGLCFVERKDPLFYILMLHLENLYLLLVIAFLPFGDHPRAAWVFHALPAPGARALAPAVEKAFFFRLGIPLFLMNALVLSVLWSPLEGPVHAACALLAGLFPAAFELRRLKAYPFTREFKGSVSPLFSGLLGTGFAVLLAAAALQFGLVGRPLSTAILCLVLAALHGARLRAERRRLRYAPPPPGGPAVPEGAETVASPGGGGRTNTLGAVLRAYALLYGIFGLAALLAAGLGR